MRHFYQTYKSVLSIILLLVILSATSCKKFVELDPPENKIYAASAFDTDISATAAILALYNYGIFNSQIPFLQNLTFSSGVSSDELNYTLTTTPEIIEFQNNAITIGNGRNNTLWANGFSELMAINSAISGLNNSTSLTPSVKSQLMGEAKFFRAFTNFYLVNMYGGIPLITQPEGLDNAYLPRTSADDIYATIIADLREAQSLLPTTYVGSLRSRVNKLAATALLARVYLYRNDNANAESLSTQVIGTGTYTLPAPALAFVNTSNEVILQFATFYGFSSFAQSYRTATSDATVAPPTYTLNASIVNSFESGDTRKTNWVDSTTSGSKFYRINKYKIYTAATAGAGNESNVVLRLAEQYLIRAEARARQGNLSGASSDLNVVRTRAGLPNLTNAVATSPTLLSAAIAQERKVELFGEFGHRWFDLLRTGQANTVLSPLKQNWNATRSVLFPIPDPQRQLNTNLTQNPGY